MSVHVGSAAAHVERVGPDMTAAQVVEVLAEAIWALALPICEQDPDVWGDQA